MKTYFSLLISGLLLFAGVNIQAVRPENKPISAYTYTPAGADDAKEIIADIIAVIGLKANFEVMASADIPNAGAVTYRGKRYIAYNPQFITKLNVAAGNKWASVSVLAHEIGHHLNGHTLLTTSCQPLELEADEFSGFVLKKMGATLSQSLAAMKIAADYKPGLSHPGQQDRISAITKGWNNAGGPALDIAKYNNPVTEETVTEEPVIAKTEQPVTDRNERAVLNSKYVLATVDFPSDRGSNYYVTTAFNVVKVSGNGQLSVLGKMMRTNSEDYPFVMVGEKTGTLFIQKNGKIVTAEKELAGYLRKA